MSIVRYQSYKCCIYCSQSNDKPSYDLGLSIRLTYSIPMAYNDPSLAVHVKITVDPKNSETFLKALKPTFEKVIEEPLNTFFEVYRDPRNPGVFKLVEHWNATPEYMKNVSRYSLYTLCVSGGSPRT